MFGYWIKKLIARLTPLPDRRTSRRIAGDRGEREAERFYREAGYTVLARNWCHGRDEIDLVVLTPDRSMPVFVEVKTRREDDRRGGYAAVDRRKKIALRRAVRGYLRATGASGGPWRFDILEVRTGESDALRVIHHCAVRLSTK